MSGVGLLVLDNELASMLVDDVVLEVLEVALDNDLLDTELELEELIRVAEVVKLELDIVKRDVLELNTSGLLEVCGGDRHW